MVHGYSKFLESPIEMKGLPLFDYRFKHILISFVVASYAITITFTQHFTLMNMYK